MCVHAACGVSQYANINQWCLCVFVSILSVTESVIHRYIHGGELYYHEGDGTKATAHMCIGLLVGVYIASISTLGHKHPQKLELRRILQDATWPKHSRSPTTGKGLLFCAFQRIRVTCSVSLTVCRFCNSVHNLPLRFLLHNQYYCFHISTSGPNIKNKYLIHKD